MIRTRLPKTRFNIASTGPIPLILCHVVISSSVSRQSAGTCTRRRAGGVEPQNQALLVSSRKMAHSAWRSAAAASARAAAASDAAATPVPAERAPASASVSVRARGGGATRSSGGAHTSRSSRTRGGTLEAQATLGQAAPAVPPSRGSVLHRVDSARAICVESAHSASMHGGMERSEAFDKVWRAHHSMALAKRCASHLPIPRCCARAGLSTGRLG